MVTKEDYFSNRANSLNSRKVFNHQESIRIIQDYCGKDAWILDVGSGTGIVSRALAENGNHVLSVDRTINMLENDHGSHSRVVADACQLPFSNKSFDCVLCRQAIHYFENIDLFYHEARRVLKNGFSLVIAQLTSFSDEDYDYWKKILECCNPHRIHFFSKNDIIDTAKKASFELTSYSASRCKLLFSEWSAGINRKNELFRMYQDAPQSYTELNQIKNIGHDDFEFSVNWSIFKFNL
ncbi:class I SAM-dependent methyltransferase [Salidesulfovibrio brasiliensis]|uniref:class I SAM-dependent methyltransferase n=1 Tax=Salidesulfovibrio brasiliensis TaxID=221711 RepID=UPI000A521D32|nr:class I SAM-dependent methyltransferase [Salidesulfovibrio brasiliensis]